MAEREALIKLMDDIRSEFRKASPEQNAGDNTAPHNRELDQQIKEIRKAIEARVEVHDSGL